jgi:aldose 1-epimerase
MMSAIIAPDFGGRIVSLTHGERQVLRPTPETALEAPSVYEFAGFPLMPYSGPLFGLGFTFAGEVFHLDRTVREEPTATHGDAWIARLGIKRQSQEDILLIYQHVPREGTFPFRWDGEIAFAVAENVFSISLRVTSRDHRLMPVGIGFHPYFPKPPGTRLRFNAVAVWPPDAPEAVKRACEPIPPGLDFTDGLDVSEVVLDRLYEGWDGRAELTLPDGWRTVVEADGALSKLQLYSAWDYPYVCVEPVSNANDGFNRMAAGVPCHGVRVLDPGQSIEGEIRIKVEPGACNA